MNTTVIVLYHGGEGNKPSMQIHMDTLGLQAAGFVYDIQQARKLLMEIGACIKEWEEEASQSKEDHDG